MRARQFSNLASSVALLFVCGQPVMAQVGKLVVRVNPREAFIYADGEPVAEARGHYVCLTQGEHKIDIYNYGYKAESRNVTITAHKKTVIEVTLQATPGNVSGPWGCITLEGAPRAAVLLNGKEPEVFFVGHGDEFDNEWGWKQELIVPPGKHELTVKCDHQDPWSISVTVPPDHRVVVDAYKGERKTVPWSRGEKSQSRVRFRAGIASAEVAVEKVTGQFAASTGQVNCGDSAHLTWSSTGAGKAELNGAPVSTSGDQTVQPKQTTDYKFTAAGPGGIYSSNSTVNVNTAIPVSLSVSPAEVHYHKIGEKVDQPGSATVTWSAGNADTVSIDPLGSVGANGSREIPVTPTKTSIGPIDETVTYTLHAGNACGGSETRTAALHITGSIEGQRAEINESELIFNSIYFPTSQPARANPQGGLAPSQEKRLEETVGNFKQYLTLHPQANLVVDGYADVRGPAAFNLALSQRRAERVKSYLVEHGIPAERIETHAFGKTKNLTRSEVKELAAQEPNLTPEDRHRLAQNLVVFWWANNRRVDAYPSTLPQASHRLFPYNSDDLNVLLGRRRHTAKKKVAKK